MVRKIIQHCNERQTVKHGDIDSTTTPVTIHIGGETTKNGESRTTIYHLKPLRRSKHIAARV